MAPNSPTKVKPSAGSKPNPNLVFRDEIAGVQRTSKTEEGVLRMEGLTLKEGEMEGGDATAATDAEQGTVKDRFLCPSPSFIGTLASLLIQQIELNHGEVMLHLGSHNLVDRNLTSILESEDCTTPATGRTIGLHKVEQDKVMQVVESAARIARAEVWCVWNAFDEKGGIVSPAAEKQDGAANNEETIRRWNAQSTRIMIRRTPENTQDLIELRVACVGNVDAGKSTLLGTLTKGFLDDGRGRARVALFRHKHELESGRTSSVGMEVMGFDAKGRQVLPDGAIGILSDPNAASSKCQQEPHFQSLMQPGLRKQQLSWGEICRRAAKVVSFIDLAGHERYLKTTIFGLTGCAPDFVLLVIGANAGLIGMSKEHLSVALALSVPVVAVVTKVDMTPPNVLEQTLKQLSKILRSPGCRKTPVFVKGSGMAAKLAQGFVKARACPVFLVSNVTGDGLDSLKTFLNTLPSAGVEGQYPVDEPLEFSISDVFSVPFVGTVVSGVMLSGRIAIGDSVLLGPDSLGHYTITSIKSIQRKRVDVNAAEAGQSVSFSLKRIRRNGVRKGMVILPKTDGPPPKAVRQFEGQILVLYHNSTIQPNYQAMLHVGSVRQTVKILSIENSKVLRTGDRAQVQFEFIKSPEHIKIGQKILFREGKTKGLGVITKVGG